MVYLNGRPLSLGQKIIMGIVSACSLVIMFMFGFVLLIIGLVIGGIVFISVWWKMRKIKKQFANQPNNFEEMLKAQMSSQPPKNSEGKGETIEGSFRKL